MSGDPFRDLIPIVLKHCDPLTQIRCRAVCRRWKDIVNDIFRLPTIEWQGKWDDEPFDYVPGHNCTVQWIDLAENREVTPFEVLTEIEGEGDTVEQIIKETYFWQDGNEGERSWYILGQTRAERGSLYFFMDASCDLCGFHCIAHIQFFVSRSLLTIILWMKTCTDHRNIRRHIFGLV
jgi:hypothetical protein